MRTSRLGRWLLRGALVAAGIAAIGGTGAHANSMDGEFSWGSDTYSGDTAVVDEAHAAEATDVATTGREEGDDFSWG